VSARLGLLTLAVLIPFPLAAAPAHDFHISGTVVSARDGSPVAHCRITASAVPAKDLGSRPASLRREPGGFGRGDNGGGPPMGGGGRRGGSSLNPETTCDDSGRFTLTVSRAGGWMLNATARGFRSQLYEEHEGFYSAVILTEAAPTFNLNFKLKPDSILTGLVYDETGEPVTQALVSAELVPERNPGSPAGAVRPRMAGVGQTDDLGRYEIGGLAPGSYRLRVQARPWYSNSGDMIILRAGGAPTALATPSPDPSLDLVFPVTWFPGVDDESSAQTIPLAAGELRQADFHLTAIPSFHLRVPRPDAPAQNATQSNVKRDAATGRVTGSIVMPQQQQQQPFTITRVSTDGMGGNQQVRATLNGSDWDFGGLTPGTYEVRMNGPNGRPTGEVRRIEVRAGSQTVLSLDSARPTVAVTIRIEGVPDSEVSTVELVDTETGQRLTSMPERGRHGGPGGPPDRLRRDDEDDADPADLEQELREGAGNPGRTLNVAPHTYEVYVNGMYGDYLTGMTAVGAKATGRTVTIDGAATLVLKVAKTHAALDGVARIGGKPAGAAMVLLVPATLGAAGDLNAIERDETNTDGTFLLQNIVPGRYILVAIDHGWDVKWRDPETLAQYLLHGVPVDLRTVAKAHEEIVAAEP
jgi:hypothetical protein